MESTFAIHPASRFAEPRFRLVRDVDDDTLHALLADLASLRRVKGLVALAAFLAGSLVFGVLPHFGVVESILIYITLGGLTLLPALGIGTLSVRRLFLREAKRHGLSSATAMLVLTRAERRARTIAPWASKTKRAALMAASVRQWDQA